MTSLFTNNLPYTSLHLPVGNGHELYVEACGNPDGIPVVFLHGGPGAGIRPKHRTLFDPEKYHAILFDQRGAGQSRPHASTIHNTTWDCVADIERIREHFGIERWLVFGGSWGSTLGLTYALTHPERCLGLILRGIFLCTPKELTWFYQAGCSQFFPELWARYQAVIPPNERHDMIAAYHRRLTDPDPSVRRAAAVAWSTWEWHTLRLLPPSPEDQQRPLTDDELDHAVAMACIECHYFMHQCFFDRPDYLLHHAREKAVQLAQFPIHLVHGRYDMICPVESAVALHQALPHSTLTIVPDAGHAFDEPGIEAALREYLDNFTVSP